MPEHRAEEESEPAYAPEPPKKKAPPIVGPDIGELIARALRAVARFLWRVVSKVGRGLWTVLKFIAKIPLRIPRAVSILARKETRAAFVEDVVTAPRRAVRHVFDRINAIPLRSRAQLLVLLAVAAVFAHGLIFSLKRQVGINAAKAYEASLMALQQAESEFEAGMIYDSETRSRERLDAMQALVGALPESTAIEKKNKADAQKSFADEVLKFRRIVTIAPVTFAKLEDPSIHVSRMAWLGDKLYLFSDKSAQVRVLSRDGAAIADPRVADTTGVTTAASGRTGFLLESASGTVSYWNPDTGETVSFPESLTSGTPIVFYQGRLYAAHPDGTVDRRGVTSKDLGTPADVLRGGPNAPSGLAVDGAVYLLSRDGSTRRYLKGALIQEYSASTIEPTPGAAGDLWASADSGRLAFADIGGDRFYLVDKMSGRLLAQQRADEFQDIRAFTVDDAGTTAYILAGSGTIYTVPIK